MNNKRPRVKKETTFTYFNKFGKKTVSFTPKKDEVMATFHPGTDAETSKMMLKDTALSVSQMIDLERGFAVLRVHPDQETSAVMDTLSRQLPVANTIPVFSDQEGLTRYFLPDEFTVQFVAGTSKATAEKIISDHKCSILSEQRTPGYYTLLVPEGKGLFETINEFAQLPEVAFVEPSEVGFNDALYTPDDPEFNRLWGMHNTGQVVQGVAGTADCDIDAPCAWDISRGDPDVIIAVIDTGIDLDHPDLQANLLPRGTEDWDFADAGDSSPEDTTDGHGSHVAGIAAGCDNAAGVIGVAPKCRIMPLRVNLSSGMNQNRADAINYVATQATAHPGFRYVINCSWKMSGDHAGVHNAIINAIGQGVVVVFAAGNTWGGAVTYPARYTEPIAVANTNNRDVIDGSSAVGPEVDVCAPGTDIYSTFPDNTYVYLTGTSMSSPHVAGLAALILSKNSTLTVAQVRDLIQNHCDNIDALNPTRIGKIGHGRINACRSLNNTPFPPIKWKIIKKLKFPQKNNGSSSGLSFARKNRFILRPRPVLMFLTQQPYSEKIYYMDPSTGAVLGSVDPVNNDTIGSLEWDGKYIRVANVTTGAGYINTIHPATGVQLGSIPVPAGRGEGLAFDGKAFYYSVINRIYVIDKVTGGVVRSFLPPGGSCRALAYGKGWLFSGNSGTRTITVFDKNTLAVRGTIPAPGGATDACEGIAFDTLTDRLFIANQGDNTIYVVQLDW